MRPDGGGGGRQHGYDHQGSTPSPSLKQQRQRQRGEYNNGYWWRWWWWSGHKDIIARNTASDDDSMRTFSRDTNCSNNNYGSSSDSSNSSCNLSYKNCNRNNNNSCSDYQICNGNKNNISNSNSGINSNHNNDSNNCSNNSCSSHNNCSSNDNDSSNFRNSNNFRSSYKDCSVSNGSSRINNRNSLSIQKNNHKNNTASTSWCSPSDRAVSGRTTGRVSSFWTRHEWTACYVSVGLAALLCYANNLDGDFVHDDVRAIQNNPDVLGKTPVTDLFRNDFWGKPMSDRSSHKSYRPLCVLSFRWNLQVEGLTPRGYHWVNNLLHCVASVLFADFCRRVVFSKEEGRLTSTYTAALLFAVHPIHTEAVTGLVGRADVLCGVFFLLALRSYFRRSRWSDASGHADSRGTTVATFVFAGVALLCKEQGITVLGVCALHEIFTIWQSPSRRCRVTSSPKTSPARGKLKSPAVSCAMYRLVSLSFMIVVLLSLRIWMLGGHLPTFREEDNPASFSPDLVVRVLSYLYLWSFNAWLFLWPSGLSHDWQMGSIPLVRDFLDARNLASLALVVLVCGLVKRVAFQRKQSKHNQSLFWALVLTVVPFLPASNVFLRVGFVVAERILYIPSMGLTILVAVAVDRVLSILSARGQHHSVRRRAVLGVVLGVLLLTASLRTVTRNRDWRSRETLARSGLTVLPDNAKMHYNMANILADKGDLDKAIHHYRQAVRLWPDYPSAHNNLATHLSNTSDALWHLSETLRTDPCHTNALTNMASIYHISHNDTHRAVLLLEKAVSCGDENHRPYLSLAALYEGRGMTQLAEIHYRTAVSLATDRHDVHSSLGLFYEAQGLYADALEHLLRAYDLDPDNLSTLGTLARVYRMTGARTEAEGVFHRVLQRSRESSVLSVIGTFYYNTGQVIKAVDLFTEAYVKDTTTSNIMNLSYGLTKLGLLDQAEQLLRTHPQEVRGSHKFALQLANIYGLRQQHKQAITFLSEWLELNAEDLERAERAAVYQQMGSHLRDANDLHTAAEYFLKAVKLGSNNKECHHNLGVYYHKQGDLHKADFHYQAALKIDSTDELLKLNHARLHQARSSGSDVNNNNSNNNNNNNSSGNSNNYNNSDVIGTTTRKQQITSSSCDTRQKQTTLRSSAQQLSPENVTSENSDSERLVQELSPGYIVHQDYSNISSSRHRAGALAGAPGPDPLRVSNADLLLVGEKTSTLSNHHPGNL